MNKIYNVIRLDQWNKAQEVYTGRIRDCKKSLKTIGEEYKKRGWEVKNYDFTLILRSSSSDNKTYIYLIHYPELCRENRNNTCPAK